MDPLFFTKSESLQEIKKRRLIKSMGFNNKVIITNGFNGSGKTLVAPLVSSMKNVELMSFAYELVWASSFLYSNQLDHKAYKEFVKMFVDHSIYNMTMGRSVNCRPSDLSSIFRNNNRFKYIIRMFSKGDNEVPQQIINNHPVLSLVTCHLLPFYKNLANILRDRLLFIETVRDPLYMYQQLLILHESVINDNLMKVKDFTLRVESSGVTGTYLDYYSDESVFKEIESGSSKHIVISYIERIFNYYFNLDIDIFSGDSARLQIIPFEQFVISPQKHLNSVLNFIDSDWSKSLKKEMKKQKVPRKLIGLGKNLKIYRRFSGNTGIDKSITIKEEKAKKRLEVKNLLDDDLLYQRLIKISDKYYEWIDIFKP